MHTRPMTRRRFLEMTAQAVGTTAALTVAGAYGAAGGVSTAVAAAGMIPTRPLGRTGVDVSMLGLGGHHIGRIRDDAESIALIRRAIDEGVTFLDNAWEYHNGRSEDLMGRALLDGYRKKVFLMTKHHGRDRKTAMQHLEESLRRLRTDVIDLWQFHEIVYDGDPEMIFAPDGGIEAAVAAKKQGKVRFIGYTGHRDPMLHLKMLAYGYPWDAVQMPLNVFDAQYKSFEKHVVPILVRRGIGVIAMKTMASGHLLSSGLVTPEQALRYVWSLPVSTIVSGMENTRFLEANIALARAFRPMDETERQALLDKTRQAAESGRFEPFKTAPNYDGPISRRMHGIR